MVDTFARFRVTLRAATLAAASIVFADHATGTSLAQFNLVASDSSIHAKTIDPNLVNPWGMAFGSGGPWWISDNGTGLATLYDGGGTICGTPGTDCSTFPTSVTIPPPAGQVTHSSPTGLVFNPIAPAFFVTENGKSHS
jgi:hypothetical protein